MNFSKRNNFFHLKLPCRISRSRFIFGRANSSTRAEQVEAYNVEYAIPE
jgi:hypothetical protein